MAAAMPLRGDAVADLDLPGHRGAFEPAEAHQLTGIRVDDEMARPVRVEPSRASTCAMVAGCSNVANGNRAHIQSLRGPRLSRHA